VELLDKTAANKHTDMFMTLHYLFNPWL